jgi:parallel beta-helix repeat protein
MKNQIVLLALVLLAGCSVHDNDIVKPQTQALGGPLTLKAKTSQTKRIIIAQGSDSGSYIDGYSFAYVPGDTLVLTATKKTWSYFSLEGFHGTAAAPVVVINQGGQVNMVDGMAFSDCTYMKITGTGTSDKYGFNITDPADNGVGIDIFGRSSDIEVCNVYVHHKLYGFWVKEEAQCADSLQFPNWVINDISIHDNLVSNVNQEGMYLGSTDPNGTRQISCNGSLIEPKPLRLGNIKVYDNIVDSTNRSGIQLSGADHGTNQIYGNTISYIGYELNVNQGNGISLGGYTQANVHNNNIKNTYAMGIFCLGAGFSKVENNTITNSGHLGNDSTSGMANIMVDTRLTSPTDSTKIWVENNALSKCTDYNIRVYETYPTYGVGNIFSGNTGTINVVPTIKWSN